MEGFFDDLWAISLPSGECFDAVLDWLDFVMTCGPCPSHSVSADAVFDSIRATRESLGVRHIFLFMS